MTSDHWLPIPQFLPGFLVVIAHTCSLPVSPQGAVIHHWASVLSAFPVFNTHTIKYGWLRGPPAYFTLLTSHLQNPGCFSPCYDVIISVSFHPPPLSWALPTCPHQTYVFNLFLLSKHSYFVYKSFQLIFTYILLLILGTTSCLSLHSPSFWRKYGYFFPLSFFSLPLKQFCCYCYPCNPFANPWFL